MNLSTLRKAVHPSAGEGDIAYINSIQHHSARKGGSCVATINIHEAKTNLSKLIDRMLIGEEIIIAKAGKPVARLVPVEERRPRVPGIARGRVTDAFFEPLSETEIEAWEQ